MKSITYLFIAVLIITTACDPEIEINQTTHSGNANFSHYIAVGNSLTAGYADQGLYPESQMTSFPNLLSEQMQFAGGGDFKQPLMPGNGSGYLYLINTPTGPGVSVLPPNPNAYDKVTGPFNNLGIPFLRAMDVTVSGYGVLNDYLRRILPNGQDTKSYLQLVEESEPTFFTCWIGNNDVLLYAVSGGKFGIEGEVGTGINGITPIDNFTLSYASLMNAFGNAKGIVITVPDILLTPLFTTIPKSPIPLNNVTIVNQLNQAYAAYNQGVDAYNAVPENQPKLGKIQFILGANYPVVEDKSIPDASGLPKISQLTQDGYLLLTLPVEKILTDGWGIIVPIPDEYALTAKEANNIKEATAAYNEVIKTYESVNIGLFESTQLLQKVANGMIINGATISSEFIAGGIFSIDGVHLTPRGNAFLTNELIKAINQKFNSTLHPLVVTQYHGVKFP